jgi:two-component system, OmpR family, response regulator VicR
MKEDYKIFYVEDDEALGFITKDQLEENGYEVFHYSDGQQAVDAFLPKQFDLAILDVMLPNVDGFTIATKIREKDAQIPILFLSAKSLQEDRLKGFELGADDYLTKPFSMEELIYKIKVFLKRSASLSENSSTENQKIGKYELDMDNLSLLSGDTKQELTVKEADLLSMLIKNANKTIKREDILLAIWGKNDYFLGRSLDVFISRLRKYLADDAAISIHTIRGVGFRLEVQD